jgi:hypothetical protein
LPTGFTVAVIVALLVTLPEVPATVTVKVPIVAVLVADRVKTLVVDAGFVAKMAPTPFGRPDAVKFTLPLKPFRGWIVIVAEPEDPWGKVRLVGDAESVKLGCVVDPGQLLTKLAALTVPMPVAKSQPIDAP